ncbi:MAG TPA: plastocyanin/azurin family copper-binding protein, partial [Roseimicrobium sp.]|nr:plastocyanin/azurin family copper-binding protein [Roseimicrobium sp.]
MNSRMHVIAMLVAAVAMAGLTPMATAASQPAKPKPQKIEITIVPGALRYAITRFDATAGQPLELTLKNTCVMPHNLVLVAPGKADSVFELAMGLGDGLAKNYVPDSTAVLTATKLVNSGQSEVLSFKVPDQPGEYPYLCTFPGHGAVMRGVMRVVPVGTKLEKPVVETFGTPLVADALRESGATSNPMGRRERPFVMRSFVPNPGLGDDVLSHHDRATAPFVYDPAKGVDITDKTVPTTHGIPAGVAVSFGRDFAYVWDSTECRLLYAWTNG